MRGLAALLCLLATPLSAQTVLPWLHDVTGVAANDELNIRQAPSASAPAIGALPPDARDVEVIAADPSGKWGQVNVGETSGWAALRFLAPQDPGDYALHRSLDCSGTEPFWTLRITQGQSAEWITPDEREALPSAGTLTPAFGRTDRYSIGFGDGGGTAIIRRSMCSDDMTDRAYGLEIDYLFDRDGPTLYTGCCSLSPG